ncbi:unnamed protein product [Caenorhabditis angaria]|uniref:Uncharacterized protein n=1 Tax=Caenorhabditis angaria TaxID=860376 RepID=A0A9P1IZF5_9PELO|nr:unnamed protein product [Caenorhabditis angaria]
MDKNSSTNYTEVPVSASFPDPISITFVLIYTVISIFLFIRLKWTEKYACLNPIAHYASLIKFNMFIAIFTLSYFLYFDDNFILDFIDALISVFFILYLDFAIPAYNALYVLVLIGFMKQKIAFCSMTFSRDAFIWILAVLIFFVLNHFSIEFGIALLGIKDEKIIEAFENCYVVLMLIFLFSDYVILIFLISKIVHRKIKHIGYHKNEIVIILQIIMVVIVRVPIVISRYSQVLHKEITLVGHYSNTLSYIVLNFLPLYNQLFLELWSWWKN